MFYLEEEKLLQQLKACDPADFEKTFVEAIKTSTDMALNKYNINELSEQMKEMLKVVNGLYLGYRIIDNGFGGNILFIC